MKNILIFAGGTGSIALQTGLHELYGKSLNIDIVISAYDNGKSTGECRKIFNGKILGPSDLRKNQLTQFYLINDISNPSKDNEDKVILYKLFEQRFTRVKWQDSYDYAVAQTKIAFAHIKETGFGSSLYDKKEALLLRLLDYFFFEEYASLERSVRKTILTADLSDFSISNMYYAAAAALNGNSLAKAGKLMADILGIPNNVHLISDVNLYLHAETKSGSIISDEGTIVTYDNNRDPIQSVLLLDEKGKPYIPWIDESILCKNTTSSLIQNADIIIFSSGTQWSSLIPTYMHRGLREKIKQSKAAKYLVMNNKEDRDMKGVDASHLLDIVGNFLPMDDIKVIINTNAENSMSCVNDKWNSKVIKSELSKSGSKTHDPKKIVSFILNDYYRPYLSKPFYFFDFDDTIWSSSKEPFMRKISKENLMLLYRAFHNNSIIISGNSHKHFAALESKFNEALSKCETKDFSLPIYCNGGNCVYHLKNGFFEYDHNIVNDYNLNDDYFKLSNLILTTLKSNGWNINLSNFENRGNCILSIKPLDNREHAKELIENVIKEHFLNVDGTPKYTPYINGNTTIDIMNSKYNKSIITPIIASEYNLSPTDIVYVGDKTSDGNDSCVINLGYTILSVDDVIDFNIFAKTYINKEAIQ